MFFSVGIELGSISFVKRIALGLGFPTEAPPPFVQLESAVTVHEYAATAEVTPPSTSCPMTGFGLAAAACALAEAMITIAAAIALALFISASL
jgi:hypothetical protein